MQGNLVSLIWAFLLWAPLWAQPPIRFAATVKAGESFVHPLGRGLFFVVEQSDGGTWNYQVKASPDAAESYGECLTSPFLHGPDTDDLVAWRFASGAEAGYAQSVPFKVQFGFTTNAADQKYECANQTAMYEAFQLSQRAGRAPVYDGLAHYRPRPRGEVTVLVSSVTLKPGLKLTDAEFGSVSFQAIVRFPATPPRRSRGSTRSQPSQ